MTRLGLEPTVYRTRGEYANHYATDAVDIIGMRYNRKTIDIKPLVKVKLFYFFLTIYYLQ